MSRSCCWRLAPRLEEFVPGPQRIRVGRVEPSDRAAQLRGLPIQRERGIGLAGRLAQLAEVAERQRNGASGRCVVRLALEQAPVNGDLLFDGTLGRRGVAHLALHGRDVLERHRYRGLVANVVGDCGRRDHGRSPDFRRRRR